MNLEDIYALCEDENELLAFLQFNNLILSEKRCTKCKVFCKLTKRGESFVFVCKKCRKQYTSTPGKFFLCNKNLKYDKVLELMVLFVNNVTVTQAKILAGVSMTTGTYWFQYFRELCENEMLNSKNKIGGVNKIVEIVDIDESVVKRGKKNERIVKIICVVGGIERESQKCFFVPVLNRNSQTLKAVIEEYVQPHTTIITDEWHGYNELEKIDIKHLKEKHSIDFVDSKTGAHTKSTKGIWSKIKSKLPNSGTYKNYLKSYLCTYLWIEQHKNDDLFLKFTELMRNFSPKIEEPDYKSRNSWKETGRKRKRNKNEESLKLVVCASTLLNQPRSLGGEDKTVEIDLTFFNKRKNKDGKMVPDQWIFGGICRETEEVFLCAVPDTTEDVIIQCIKSNIQPGTTIISECHPSYVDIENIEGYQYKHLMVNNRKNFVDLASYANIQKIKNIWSILNERNKKQCGIYRKMLDSYLSEFVWRQRYANKDIFVNILKDIATCHSSNVLHSSLGSKPSVNFEEKAKKRKRSNEESSKSKGSEISSQKNPIKDVKIAENAPDSRVKVICHVSPEDFLHTIDDDKPNENRGTIPERLQSQENFSGNILGQAEDDPLRSSSDDELMRMEGCVNEFEMFGKSVANRLNQMPQNKAQQLRLRIEELIKNFRQQIFIKPFNVSTSTPPLCDGNVMYFKEGITDDVVK